MYLRDAVAGPLHGALLRNAWLDSVYMFCDGCGCVGCIAVIFCVKESSDPEVVSVLLSWSASHAEWRGVHRRIFSFLPSWWSHLESGQYFSEPFVFSRFCVRWSSVA